MFIGLIFSHFDLQKYELYFENLIKKLRTKLCLIKIEYTLTFSVPSF